MNVYPESTLATYSTTDTYTWTWTMTTVHLMSGGHALVDFYSIFALMVRCPSICKPNFLKQQMAYSNCTRGKNVRYYFDYLYTIHITCNMEAKSASVCSSVTLHYFYAKYSRCTQREQTQIRISVGSKWYFWVRQGEEMMETLWMAQGTNSSAPSLKKKKSYVLQH